MQGELRDSETFKSCPSDAGIKTRATCGEKSGGQFCPVQPTKTQWFCPPLGWQQELQSVELEQVPL